MITFTRHRDSFSKIHPCKLPDGLGYVYSLLYEKRNDLFLYRNKAAVIAQIGFFTVIDHWIDLKHYIMRNSDLLEQ